LRPRDDSGESSAVKAHARALLAAVPCLFWSVTSPAEPACGRPGKPWVSVEFGDRAWPESLKASVLGDLRVGLGRHGIDACLEGAGPSEPKLAAVRIAWLEEPRVVVTVEIKDSVTQKRVSRDIDLSGVPSDGRGFAIAIATDELVWATWVELALVPRATTPKRSAPPEVVAGVEAELPDEPESRLGVAAALEHFGGGQTHLGGDALLYVPFPGRFSLDARLGVRAGQDTASEHGRVLAQALGAAAHLRFALVRASSLELAALAGARVALLRLEGEASPGGTDAAESSSVVTARAGVASSLELARGLWLEVAGTAGYAVRGFEATDDGNVVSGASGTELGASLGFLVER
jgi:hypothetical protein